MNALICNCKAIGCYAANCEMLWRSAPPEILISRATILSANGRASDMNFTEQFVQRDRHRIYARDYAGEEPAIILMHGFPDNLHLYDRLVPHLSPPRRVITFDFLGWGASD